VATPSPEPTTRQPGPPISVALDGGLELRVAGPDDVDAVVDLTASVFGGHDAAPTRAYLTGALGAEWLVVAAPEGRLVSASARIPHPFALDGLPLPGSQVEYVVTDPAFRDRRLVRAQFEVHHARAKDAGELVQLVGGIPYLYRKLGYGYAHDHPAVFLFDEARLRAAARGAGPTGPGAPDPGPVPAGGRPPAGGPAVRVRPATREDRTWLADTERRRPRLGLRVGRDTATWDVWLAMTAADPHDAGPEGGAFGRPGGTFDVLEVAERHGRPVGWFRAHAIDEAADLYLLAGWADDDDAGLALLAHAHDLAAIAGGRVGEAFTVVGYDSPGTTWGSVQRHVGTELHLPTGMYGRMADPLAVLSHLRPLLDARLCGLPPARASGSLVLSTYTSAVGLRWEDRRITAIEAAPPDPDPFGHGGVGVAPDWLPALVLGRWGARGLAERADDVMLGAHADVMDLLFPARPSDLAADF
jgi:hypothetical protein